MDGFRRRLDFVVEVDEEAEATGDHCCARFRFDLNRYEPRTVNGEFGLWDRYDSVFYGRDVLDQVAQEFPRAENDSKGFLEDMPANADTCIEERRAAIERAHEEDSPSAVLPLGGNFGDQVSDGNFAVVCVDIVGSTILSQQLGPTRFRDVIACSNQRWGNSFGVLKGSSSIEPEMA